MLRIIRLSEYGEFQDQGTDKPNNGLHHNYPLFMIQYGILNHHVTCLDPVSSLHVNIDELDNMKFDVATRFNVNE